MARRQQINRGEMILSEIRAYALEHFSLHHLNLCIDGSRGPKKLYSFLLIDFARNGAFQTEGQQTKLA